MNQYLSIVLLVFVFMGGFSYGSLNNYVETIDHCTDFKFKNTEWKGYRTISENNERRCFFIEQKYPYRVWQGVEKI